MKIDWIDEYLDSAPVKEALLDGATYTHTLGRGVLIRQDKNGMHQIMKTIDGSIVEQSYAEWCMLH